MRAVIGLRWTWLVALCAVFGSLAFAPAAQAATDPLFVFTPSPQPPPPPPVPPPPIVPPPTGYLNGPCGLAVDSSGRFYVADYYHHAVDVFNSSVDPAQPWASYVTQLANVDPQDGPCGLALGSANNLYVNNYHRNVAKFGPSPSFAPGPIFPLPAADTEEHLPTGVAVNTTSGNVFVNHRTYVAVFDSNGIPVEEAGEPLVIGAGSLGNAYGVAVSQFPATLGRLYVPDAATNTVKVYNPAVDKANPVAELKDPFSKPFVSLRDSAIAVDRVTGDVYFADNLQPLHTERPQASVYVYSSTNTYKGRLKYNVIDALPPGLAVDNSIGATQGRVYVTSGNTDKASIYAYGPGSATSATPLPPLGSGLPAPGSSGATTTSNDEVAAQNLKRQSLTTLAGVSSHPFDDHPTRKPSSLGRRQALPQAPAKGRTSPDLGNRRLADCHHRRQRPTEAEGPLDRDQQGGPLRLHRPADLPLRQDPAGYDPKGAEELQKRPGRPGQLLSPDRPQRPRRRIL